MIPKWKGDETVHKHEYYTEEQVNNFKKKSKDNLEMQLYVELSIEIAPRIQDMAELLWSSIKEIT